MENEEFLEELAEIFEVEKNELQNDFEWSPNNWDSLVVVSVIALVDEHFEVTLEVEEFVNTPSLQVFMEVIQKKN
jgi:acyl carrier protein